MRHITIINPNCTAAITAGMSAAIEPLRMAGGPTIECVTLSEGPPGIESQADIERVVLPITRFIAASAADAFVIGCYSDPGLHAAREATQRPVFGIAESAMLYALTQGERFGVISILSASIARHLRYVRSLGLMDRFAGDLPIELGVTQLQDDEQVLERMTTIGKQLRDEKGADVLIMGCTGFARFQAKLQQRLGVATIEPTRTGAFFALGAVQFL